MWNEHLKLKSTDVKKKTQIFNQSGQSNNMVT